MGAIIALVFGLIYGSFLNVVIARFDDWASIVKSRSNCPHCKTTLTWYDLVPIFSYIFLRGKCRYCRKPISWQYPAVEAATAILVSASYYKLFVLSPLELPAQIIGFILLLAILGILVVIFFHDLYEMMIPDLLSNALVVTSLIYSFVIYQDYLGTLFGALTGFLPIALLVYPSRGKWMGEGDVKIALGLGLLAGWPGAAVFIILAFLLGGTFGAIGLLTKQVKLKTAVPFAPFLIIAGLIALIWGDQLAGWYLGTIGYGYY